LYVAGSAAGEGPEPHLSQLKPQDTDRVAILGPNQLRNCQPHVTILYISCHPFVGAHDQAAIFFDN